jgi:predicted N-formylglutamate amidohydrolase
MLEQANIAEDFSPAEIAPYRLLPGDTARGCLLVCDHATNRIPPGFDCLGLDEEQMERHIAYDPGGAGVTAGLSELLGVPAVMADFSRLLIDPNRGEDDPTLVMRLSDGKTIPGNARIGEAEIERRRSLLYDPYHGAIEQALDAGIASGRIPAILSIHTFTEVWRGRPRPWHGAILWDEDPRLAHPLIEGLRTEADLIIGDNEPYTGKLYGDCMYKHGTHRGLAHALVEIRQDLVREPEGQRRWAERLARVMEPLLDGSADNPLHKIEFYGSATDVRAGQDGRQGAAMKG